MKDFIECVGCVLFCLLAAAFIWLWCMATPDQCSAECEHERWLMEGAK